MNLPINVTSRELRVLAPNDSHIVRVIVTKVSNPGAYRQKAKRRTYIFLRNGEIGRHALDIPLSLYMLGTPTGAYRENQSISNDLTPTLDNGLIVQVIPNPDYKAPEQEPSAFDDDILKGLFQLCTKINAPDIMFEALVVAKEQGGEALVKFTETIELCQVVDDRPERTEQPEQPERAHNEDGTFTADDPATPDVNEAYKVTVDVVETPVRANQAMKDVLDIKPEPEKADEAASLFTAEEQDDLDNMQWKRFEVKYGMKKEAFRASK
jgi:hypothetical protein